MDVTEKQPIELVEEYIALRDQRDTAKKQMDDFLKSNFTEKMEELEARLLDTLNKLGVDSLASKAKGTVYKKLTTSITIADMREFQRHVIGSEQWELADWRANKTVVNDIVDRGDELPPGLNRTAFFTVGIRKGK